jgi:hypothetical protein
MKSEVKRDIDSAVDELDMDGIQLLFGALLTTPEGKAEFKVLYRAM